MTPDAWRLLLEGVVFGSGIVGALVGLFADRFIYHRLNQIFLTKADFAQFQTLLEERTNSAKELAARDNEATSKALTALSESIDRLSEEQKNLGQILARLEGSFIATKKRGT